MKMRKRRKKKGFLVGGFEGVEIVVVTFVVEVWRMVKWMQKREEGCSSSLLVDL